LKVFQFIILGALLWAGVAIGWSITDTLFLITVGPEKLPIIYMIMPLLMIIFTPLYSYLLNRYGIDTVFNMILGLLVVGGVTFLVLTEYEILSPYIYYVAKLYSFIWFIALYTIYWSFIDRYFDILDAKRLFPLFSGGLSSGAVLGGILVSSFTKVVKTEYLFLLWSFMALLALPMLYHLKKRWIRLEHSEDEETGGFIEETANVLRNIKSSRYILLLNLAMLGMIFLTTVCEYQYLDIFSRQGNTEELASLFGNLFAFANAFNLVANFFLFNRMIAFFGVSNMTLFQPLFYLFSFAFFLYDYGLGAALFGFFTYQGIQTSIDANNWNFLYNAVPSRVKTSVRTFVENLMDPVGTAIAGLFLLLFAPALKRQQISLIGFIVAGVYLICILLLRSTYLRAMITNLKKEWLDFSKSAGEILKHVKDTEVDKLETYALSQNVKDAYMAIHLLWIEDEFVALKNLLKYFNKYPEENREKLTPLLALILENENNEIIRKLLLWLEGKDFDQSPSLIEVLGSHGLIQPQKVSVMLESSNPAEQGAAAISLLNSWDISDSYKAMRVVDRLLNGNSEQKKVGIRILGKSKQERYSHFLAPYLKDRNPGIRKTALEAIFKLVNKNSNRLIPNLLEIIETGDEEERIIAMDALEKIKDSSCITPLLSISENFTPHQKRRLEKLIVSIGLQSVPTIVTVFRGRQYTATARSIAARALSKLAFPQLEIFFMEIIHTVILRGYEFLYFHVLLHRTAHKTPGLTVLSKHYKDIHNLIIEFILELLTIGGRLPDFELISASLRSNNPKIRANAIETIEQGISRDIFKILLPLVDSRSLEEKMQFYHAHFPAKQITADDILRDALFNSKFPLECSAAAQAMWEMTPGDPELLEALRTKLTETDLPLFKDTIVSLLSDRPPFSNLNIVEKVYYLASSPFFKSFGIKELQLIALGAREIHYKTDQIIYDTHQPANELYYIINGDVSIENNGDIIRKNSSQIFGENSLFGETRRKKRARSGNATVLVISKENIFNYAKTYPKIGIELLKNKLVQQP
jgi:hypothetical protein